MRGRAGPAPKFLNLLQIRFPVGAIASIAHRVSGVLLLVALPLLARTLERSLRSEADYQALLDATRSPWTALALVIVVWAAAHHVLAGVRHLLMDVGVGSRLVRARASAWTVLVAAVVLAAASAVRWLT